MRYLRKLLSVGLMILAFDLCIGLFAADARAAEAVSGDAAQTASASSASVCVQIPPYAESSQAKDVAPYVTSGNTVLKEGPDYTLTKLDYQTGPGRIIPIIVRGNGQYEGFAQTVRFTILKQDISEATVRISDATFYGGYVTPEVSVSINGKSLTAGTDYVVSYYDNVNVGTATAQIIGINDYYGCVEKEFNIILGSASLELPGTFIGTLGGTLSDEYTLTEALIVPGSFTATIDAYFNHIAYYELYRIEGENAISVKQHTTDYGNNSTTAFTYDFSSVYTDAVNDGGAIYMLVYSWVDARENVYAGATFLYISAKIPGASTMTIEQLPDINNFRCSYLSVYSEDGALATPQWSSANTDIATIDNGVVSWKQPGTVTVTATCGKLTQSITLSKTAINLASGASLEWNYEQGEAAMLYDCRLLTNGTDYSAFAEARDGVITVTAYGKGLFKGQLLRQFDAVSGQPLDHTHSFDHDCDTTCNSCDFTRAITHNYGDWRKDQNSHWHSCSVCGEQADTAVHTLSAADPNLCTVCGLIVHPADFNNDYAVDNADVVYLLWHTLFPSDYPLEKDGDLDNSGIVDNADVVFLLWHTLFPDSYPIEK